MGIFLVLIVVFMSIYRTTSEECEFFDHGQQGDGFCFAKITCKHDSSINYLIEKWSCRQNPNRVYYRHISYEPQRHNNYRIDLKIQQEENLSFLPIKEQFDHIQTLSIHSSPLTSIPSVVQSLKILTALDLSNNSINSVNMKAISDLTMLKTLNVSYNELSNLECDSTLHQSQSLLTHLDFSHNLITNLPDNCFTRLPLHSLDLSYNHIESFTVLTFKGVLWLQTLILSHNKIKAIGFSFARFNNLENLYLDNNKLTFVAKHNFETMSKLKQLNVSHNIISNVEAKCFDNLRYLKELDLSGNNIKKMSLNMFIENTFLDTLLISDNLIETLQDNFLNGTNVTNFNIVNNKLTGVINKYTFIGQFKTLNLSKSNFSKIENNAFSQVPQLNILNLSLSFIQYVEKRAFDNLTNLEVLDLSYNNISDLGFNKYYLKSLLYLNLSHNRIVQILKSTFEHLDKLNYLDISFNSIIKIENNCFVIVPKLLNLKMEGNMIQTVINENTFNGLSSMKTLNLSSSGLTSINNHSFSLTALDEIDLSKNKISKLEYECFKGVPSIKIIKLSKNLLDAFHVNTQEIVSVQVLYLNENKLTNITNETFACLVNLKQLYLGFNYITKITPQQFITLKSLIYLDLSHNINLNPNKTQLSSIDNLTLNTLNIQKVQSNFDFVRSTNLTVFNLDLSHNNIILVDSLRLYKINKLADLSLCRNEIVNVDKHSFPNMSSLVNLDLSFNIINNVQPGTFLGTPQLKSLNLSHNMIKTFKYGVFDGLKYMRYLNISQNSVVNFNFELLLNSPVVNKLSLDHNKLISLNLESKNMFGMKTNFILFIGGNEFPCDDIIKFKSQKTFHVTAEILDYHSENVDGITCVSDFKNVQKYEILSNSTVVSALNELNKNILVLNENIAGVKISTTYDHTTTKDTDLKNLYSFFKESQINYTKIFDKKMDIQNTLLLYLSKLKEQHSMNQSLIQNGPATVEIAPDSNNRNDDQRRFWNKEFFRDGKKYSENADIKAILYFGTTCIAILTVLSLWRLYKSLFFKSKSYGFNNTLNQSAPDIEMI